MLIFALRIGEDVGRRRVAGAVLVAVGFFMLHLKALSGPEMLSFPPGIASCSGVFDGQQNGRGLSYNLSHCDRKCKLQGHLVGTSVADFWLDKNHTVGAELRRMSLEPAEASGRYVQEICSRRDST